MVPKKRLRLTLVVDPRFSGGTSSAVAQEIRTLAASYDLSVVAITSQLFEGNTVHPLIEAACIDTHTPLIWDPKTVSSDIVVLHNPSFLKFDDTLNTRLVGDRLFVICHENFVRPDGPEGFDVAHCLSLISTQTLARAKYLAPISGWNRQCTEKWMLENPSSWQLAPIDWTNICEFEHQPPTTKPKDRRGRHSRPGLEKYPPIQDLIASFPPTCEAVRMLGADSLLGSVTPPHWELLQFGSEDVPAFLKTIDFFVYYTHPFWQESYGRVIAEAIAAGKVVITNQATAATFGNGVIAALPDQIDQIVARLIAKPALYAKQVKQGHSALENFSEAAFLDRLRNLVAQTDLAKTTENELENLYAFL